ncbi:exodeoxyribonuclease [Mycobacteroides abscessus]|nr:exodeoxyribonuclease [Mycobacteroides abscessus]
MGWLVAGGGLGRQFPVAASGVDGPYSWWSWRGKAFDNDAGWRIDYHLATADLGRRAHSARVERADAYALRWSDHAPVTVEYR